MIEVGTEASGRYILGERPVGGSDDPHRDLARYRLAQAPDHAFLQNTQQVGLQVHRHVADLVKEQHAAIGLLEPARAPPRRAPVKAPSA